MQKYEKIKQTITVLKKVICDLCGRESDSLDWRSKAYEENNTKISVCIKQRKGTNYPEGGWGTEYVIDLCPNCFKEKLIPWLKSEGATIEEKEWDW